MKRAICLAAALCCFYSVSALSNSNGIEVIGKASIAAVPDQFVVTMRIKERGNNAQKLKINIDHKSKRLVDAAKKLGVSDENIQSAQLNIQLIYDEHNRTRLQSFDNKEKIKTRVEVSRNITIALNSLDNYDKLIDSAIVLVGIEISPLQMTFKDPTGLYNQALDQAIALAKTKAERIAKQAGVTLGPLKQLKESSYGVPHRFAMAAEMSSAKFHSSAGNSSVSAQVTATFDVLQ